MTRPVFFWGLDGLPLVSRSLVGLTNVFVSADLTVTGTRGKFSASRGISNVALGAPDPSSFKSWEETTPEDVIAWAKARMGEDTGGTARDYEQQIEDQIAAQEAVEADLAAPVPMGFYVPPPSAEPIQEDPAPAE